MAKKAKKKTKKRARKTTKKKAGKKAKRKTAPKKKAKKRGRKKVAKKKVVKKSKSNRGRRFSTKQKQALLGKFFAFRKDGLTALQAAKKVKITYITLLKWQKELKFKAPKIKRARKAKRKVVPRKGPRTARKKKGKPGRKPNVKAHLRKATKRGRQAKDPTVAVSRKGTVVMVTPSGYRIEGITTNDLIRVLKAAK